MVNETGGERRPASFLGLRRIRTRVASSAAILVAAGALTAYGLVRFDALESAGATAAVRVSDVAWGQGIEGRILRVCSGDGRTVGSAAFKGIVVPEAERRRILAFIGDARRGPGTPAGTSGHAGSSAPRKSCASGVSWGA
ncbi:hypothetical protein AB0I77_01600 [Streptomyces sp. NPDC050619]|uniref:hypothetical protein n=1 Tax=Streptomyces sp. NPDC050619 TaxID=3157214 RepID=UPI00343A929B